MSPEQLAQLFHETYERLAPDYNYQTRKASAVPWESVPENNKNLMIAVAAEILKVISVGKQIEGNNTPVNITEKDLVYAAYVRCPCGAGMAYEKGTGINGHWDCSNVLLGRERQDVRHADKLSFAFYEITSENQPSADGATTRPKEQCL